MKKSMNLKGFLLVLGAIALVFIVAHAVLRTRANEKTGEENQLQVTLTRLQEENKALSARLEQVGTPDYIVSSAIENYSYMNKDDIRFEFSNPEALYAYTEEELRVLMDEMGD